MAHMVQASYSNESITDIQPRIGYLAAVRHGLPQPFPVFNQASGVIGLHNTVTSPQQRVVLNGLSQCDDSELV